MPEFGEPGYGVPEDQYRPQVITPKKELHSGPGWDEFMHPDRWRNLDAARQRKPETTAKPEKPVKAEVKKR